MSFLAPLFLAGLAAVAAPIIIHLVRRQTRDRQEFSSLMFLEPSPPVVKRRTKIEDWLLLALRCLVIVLLALAFARPFFIEPPKALAGAEGTSRQLIAIDTSFSMQGQPWSEAREVALDLIDRSKPEDQLAIVALGSTPETVLSFEAWNELPSQERRPTARRLVESLEPTHERNDASVSLPLLAQLVQSDAAATKTLHLISDFQRSSALEQAPPWTVDAALVPHPVQGHPRSLSISQVGGLPPSPEGHRLTLAVQNHSEETISTQVRLSTGETLPVTLDPAEREILSVSREIPREGLTVTSAEPGTEPTSVVPPRVPTVNITAIGNDDISNPEGLLYYLPRAFAADEPFRVDFRHGTAAALTDPDLLIAVAPLDPQQLETARSALARGTSLFFPASNEEMVHQAFQLADEPVAELEQMDAADDAVRLGHIDYDSSVFAPFADAKVGDFSNILFWKYWKLPDSGKTLASFEDGSPALIEMNAGNGNILLLNSSWKPDDSRLARSTKFAPLLYAIAEATASPDPIDTQLTPGTTVATPTELTAELQTADGRSARNPTERELRFEEPGLYRTDSGEAWFAVNPDPREYDTDYLAQNEFAALGWNTETTPDQSPDAREQPASAATLEENQQVWRWLLLFALLLLLAESYLAARKSRTTLTAANA